jgi:hypothetical protein
MMKSQWMMLLSLKELCLLIARSGGFKLVRVSGRKEPTHVKSSG